MGTHYRSLIFLAVLLVLSQHKSMFAADAAPTADQKQTIDKCGQAISSATTAMQSSIELGAAAKAATATINGITGSDPSDDLAGGLKGLIPIVRKLGTLGLPGSLVDQKNSLTNDRKAALVNACGADAGTDAPQSLQDVQAQAKSLEGRIADEAADLGKTNDALKAALQSIPTYTGSGVDALNDKLKPLATLPVSGSDPLPDTSEKQLSRGLPVFASVVEKSNDVEAYWRDLSKMTALTSAQSGNDALDAVKTKMTTLDASIKTIATNLAPWFNALGLSTAKPSQDAKQAVTDALVDPTGKGADAATVQKAVTASLSGVNAVIEIWPRISSDLQSSQHDLQNEIDAAAASVDTLASNGRMLRILAARLADSLAGNMNDAVTENVRLYYNTDVRRLIYLLNSGADEVGGLAGAQEEAKKQRKKLAESEFDLADAQAEVNRLQKSVIELTEQQRQQAAGVTAADLLQTKLLNQYNQAQRKQSQIDAQLQKAQAAQSATPTSPSVQKTVQQDEAKSKEAANKTTVLKDQYDQAHSQYTSANDQLEATKSDKDALPAKLEAAKAALEGAQAAVNQQRKKMLLAAEAESEAFALARDNAPFWVAGGVAADPDPIKRVTIFAFPDQATLIVRGNLDDVNKVRSMISNFDLPAPQARLTLWNLQLSADVNRSSRRDKAEQVNRALEIIDEELGNTRAMVGATLDLLRNTINDYARNGGLGPGAQNEESPCSHRVPWGIRPSSAQYTAAELNKLVRIQFFSPFVLSQFGFRLNSEDLDHEQKLLHELPDPAATTTIGEALLMLELSCQDIRYEVMNSFQVNFPNYLRGLNLQKRTKQGLVKATLGSDLEVPSDLKNAFARTWQSLGAISGPSGLTSQQFEITAALIARLKDREQNTKLNKYAEVIGELHALRDDLRANEQLKASLDQAKHKSASDDCPKKPKPSPCPSDGSLGSQLGLYSEAQIKIKEDISRIQSYKQQLIEICVDAKHEKNECESWDVNKLEKQYTYYLRDSASDRQQSLARGAAADEMLKELTVALEDDLDRLYIQPMIHRLRVRLQTDTNVRVGILQRESMLATNRLVARIDPRASAQLQVGEQQDILGSVQQLAQLYFAVQSGGALGALGALNKQPREAPPEIYAVGTGNTFQVTPIIDPSGQALRFKFDYVAQTRITEPSGGVNPQLPRVERVTVNTEVQLSNLETREISRFEVNAKIGIPTTYWGGFPILKDIPYVRPYVPLLGWFVRKAGQNAVVQQSIIFGQTTIYPSIADIETLLIQGQN